MRERRRGRSANQARRRFTIRIVWLVTSLAVIAGSTGLLWLSTSRSGASPEPAVLVATPQPSATATTAPTATATVAPTYGGRYVEGLVGRPTTLNPLFASTSVERDIAGIVFEGLTWVDGTGRAHPQLAEDWSVSDDGLQYTFALRQDVQWHDGQPFTADDVLFTVRLVQSPDFPGNTSLAMFWRGVRVDVVDRYTVTFTLLEPFSPLPNYASLPILPAHLLRGVLPEDLPDDPFNLAPVGTGPFRFERYDAEEGVLSLSRFDRYYGQRPYLDTVEFRFFESTEALVEAFRDGQVDGMGVVPWEVIAGGVDLGTDARIYAPVLSGMTALFLNHRTQFFSDLRVRQALAYAIDREGIARSVLFNQVEPGTGPISVVSWAYSPITTTVDRERARALLDDAGWVDRDGDGIRENQGVAFRFTVLVNAEDTQRLAVAQALSAQLQEVGIAATVQAVPSAALQQSLMSRQFSAAVFGWVPTSGDPDCLELWHSSQAETGLNFSGFRNQAVDTLLLQARQARSEEERRSLYTEFQRVFSEQVPAIVLYYPRYYFAVHADIGGVEPAPIIRPSDRFHALPSWFRTDTG